MLPGTGGLTRLVDKREVRRDLADVVATRTEGVTGGKTAQAWRLVDEVAPAGRFDATVRERAASRPRGPGACRARRHRAHPAGQAGQRTLISYPNVTADLDRGRAVVDDHGARPAGRRPRDAAGLHALGASFWPLAMCRELDDLILWLRINEPELGTWVLRTSGDPDLVLGHERAARGSARGLAGQRDPALPDNAPSSGST